MKISKIIILSITVLAALSSLGHAIEIEPGVLIGYRTVNSDEVNDVYGGGLMFLPKLEVGLLKWLAVGTGYEFGYSKDGKVGLYQEDATLSINGFDFYFALRFKIKQIFPFVKVGAGLYSYDQTVNTTLGEINSSDSKLGWLVSAGAKFFPRKKLAVSFEIRYSLLEFQPDGLDPVDLGGIKIFAGIGYIFNL